MKHPIRFLIGLIAAIAITLFISSNTGTTHAQTECATFDALGQMLIPTTQPLATGHRWGGQVYIKMGDEYLQGLISGDDGTVVRKRNVGHGTDGLYIIGFNCVPGSPYVCTDTINIAVPNSIFGPGAPIFDRYQGSSAYFNGGTGRFENASGNVTFEGPYIVWNNTTPPPPRTGRFNPEINGHICGVE